MPILYVLILYGIIENICNNWFLLRTYFQLALGSYSFLNYIYNLWNFIICRIYQSLYL